jgi:phosphate uptake regulator
MQMSQYCNNPMIAFQSDTATISPLFMALGGRHSLPGFEQSLEELRADILMMAALVRRSLTNAMKGLVQRDEGDCLAAIADDEEVDLLVKQVDRGGTKRVRSLIQESALEQDDEMTAIFELVERSLAEALEAFAAFENDRAEKLRRQMEPLAQRARDLPENFSDAVGTNPERSKLYVSFIIVGQSLEQIIYLIESVTEDIIYVAEARDIRHAKNKLVVE